MQNVTITGNTITAERGGIQIANFLPGFPTYPGQPPYALLQLQTCMQALPPNAGPLARGMPMEQFCRLHSIKCAQSGSSAIRLLHGMAVAQSSAGCKLTCLCWQVPTPTMRH